MERNLKLISSGSQHYQNTHLGYCDIYEKRDSEKFELCKEHGISIIYVPYTWDKSRESLKQIIFSCHPELEQIFKI